MSLILVLSNEADLRDVIAQVCHVEGYRVAQAAAGSEALKIIESFKVDLVLLDLLTPRSEGWRFLEAKASIPHLADIPVIVFTAKGVIVPRADAVVHSPYEPSEIVVTIRGLLPGTRKPSILWWKRKA